MKKIAAALAVSFVIAMVAIGYAQGRGTAGEGPGMGPGFMGRGWGTMDEQHILTKLKSLGLDEKQKDAVKEIVRTTQKETAKKRADLTAARVELKGLLDQDTVNMKSVEVKLRQIESLMTDIHLSHIKTFEAIKTKLTPDQKKKFKELREQGMMGRKGMMKRSRR